MLAVKESSSLLLYVFYNEAGVEGTAALSSALQLAATICNG